jgi:hypothetical protein
VLLAVERRSKCKAKPGHLAAHAVIRFPYETQPKAKQICLVCGAYAAKDYTLVEAVVFAN